MLGIAALVSVSTLLVTGIVPTTLGGVVVDCLQPPVTGRVVAPYVAPRCPYCVGHRTIDFASFVHLSHSTCEGDLALCRRWGA